MGFRRYLQEEQNTICGQHPICVTSLACQIPLSPNLTLVLANAHSGTKLRGNETLLTTFRLQVAHFDRPVLGFKAYGVNLNEIFDLVKRLSHVHTKLTHQISVCVFAADTC